jgi:hypothetical protein
VPHHCCPDMSAHADAGQCPDHPGTGQCPDAQVVYNATFGEYGLPVRDGATSVILIRFCPWCGARLPESARDRWFDELEAKGIDPAAGPVPDRYRDARWRT